MFKGMMSALVTPFKEVDGQTEIDYDSYRNLVEWQIENGVDGLVVYGTTGESPTLSDEEKILLTKKTIEIVGGRLPIIVGAGSNSTSGTLKFIEEISKLKIDGLLTVAPYYNRPTQEGLFEHFSLIANKASLPIVLYNVPSRTSVEISIDTIEKLSKNSNIVAIKQATDSVQNITELCGRLSSEFTVLAGDDPLTAYCMLLGGKGVISASGSVIPKEMKSIVAASDDGDYKKAADIQKEILPKINAIFSETNPTPAKALLKMKGIIKSDIVRLPLVTVRKETLDKLKKVFEL